MTILRARRDDSRFLSAARLALVAGATIGLGAGVLVADEPEPDHDASLALLYALADEPDEPMADEPDAGADSPVIAPAADPAQPADGPRVDARGRRIQPDVPTPLAFKNVSVDQIIPFIVEATGKVVLPQPDVMSRRITLLNDQPIPRARALDLVFLALQQNGIAVVETTDLIMLRDIGEIDKQDVPVLGPDENIMDRTDFGSIVEKVFSLRHASAANLFEMLKDSKPAFAKMAVDAESNQLIIMGNIGLLQRFQRIITALDQPAAASLATETFHLRFADATNVAQNIRDLFAQAATGGQNNQNPFQQLFRQQGGGGGQGGQRGGQAGNNNNRTGAAGQGAAQTSVNLRVTANTQQNSVTVLAEKQILDQVRDQISMAWDLPPDTTAIPRVYDLKYTDPIKVKTILTTLFGNPGSGATGQTNAANQDRGVNRLFGQFSFEAVPEAGQLIVVAKNQGNLEEIDSIIKKIDQPQSVGLPEIIELKHANAEELAEQLNALLAQEGTRAIINRSESGLSATGTTGASPFANQQNATNTNTQQQNNQQNAAGTMQFWWQQARPPTANSGSSNLVSKLRIVPVWRQNALMILSPPEYRHSMKELVESLDRPGRQVLLAAVIAEIAVDDATALGIRWSSAQITPNKQDNTISFGANTAGEQAGGVITGTKNNLLPSLFDTSVLNLGVNLNVLLQALAEKTSVAILSEPRIFTSDNQEAEFFSGQDVPFITESQPNNNGDLLQSFDYRAVGISLRVRPRITIKSDVDLRINLELSNIEPNQTLFGGFIIDRRETTTHLIVKNGQTVVVSGIMRTEESDIKRKVPLLADIPLIGEWLFTSTEKSKSKTELVAFITPFVVNNTEETDSVTEKDRERLGDFKDYMRPASELDELKSRKGVKPLPPAAPAPQQPAPAEPILPPNHTDNPSASANDPQP